MSIDELGIDHEGLAARGLGPGKITHGFEDIAEIAVSYGILGIDHEGLSVRGLGPGKITLDLRTCNDIE